MATRKPSRFLVPHGAEHDDLLSIRLAGKLKRRIVQRARKANQDVSEFARAVLEKACEEPTP